MALLLHAPLTLPATAGVWAHYPFDTNLTDSSGNARNGTLTDVGTVGNSGIITTAGNFKFGNGALDISADRDYVAVPSKSFAAGSPYTIAFWARKAAGDTGDRLQWDMVIGERDTTNNFIALGDTDNTVGLRWRSSTSLADRQADFAVQRDYNWHHYAFVASGTTIALYVDGVPFGTATGKTTDFVINTIGEAYVSSRTFGFHGQIDEVWIFDEALSENAIAGLYQTNNPTPAPPSTVTRLHVVLLGGQSNMDGRAVVSELPAALQSPQGDVDLYYNIEGGSPSRTTLRPGLSETAQFGPEITLGRRLADTYQGDGSRLAFIKYANGGTNLHTQWKAGGNATTTNDGPEYVTFQQTVTSGLAALAAAYPAATIDLQAMVWMQGESDAVSGPSALYQANLTNFIADVRATYGANLPFVIGRLSNKQTNLTATYLNQVRAAQDAVAAADPLAFIVYTDDFGIKSDFLHFPAAGQQLLGSAFALETAYAAWMTTSFTPADIAAGLAEPDADRDGDGQSNRAEFLAGTNALSAASSFRSMVTAPSPGAWQISYDSSAARLYSVEKYVEAGNSWTVELPALRGTGGTVVRSLVVSQPRGIYRVVSTLP